MNPTENKDNVSGYLQSSDSAVAAVCGPNPTASGACKPCGLRRRLFWAVGLAGLAVASVPLSYGLRANVFPPVFPVASIERTAEYQDPNLLARAWELPVARRFKPIFEHQNNRTTCGPSSLANVFRSLDDVIDEAGVLRGSGLCWTGACFGGVTLDELADIGRLHPSRKVTLLRDISYDEFKRHLRLTNDPRRRYIVNYQRGMLFGKGMGHHSPIGGYLEREDLVFVLDVKRKVQPWLVESRRLFDAMNSVDSVNGKTRGLVLVEPRASNIDLDPIVAEEK